MSKIIKVRLSSDAVEAIVREHVLREYGDAYKAYVHEETDFDMYDPDRAWFDGYTVEVTKRV